MERYVKTLKGILSLHFKSTRKQHKLSQNSMSEILHIAPRSYSKLEHGHYLPSACVFILYLRLCGKDAAMELLDEIIGGFHKLEGDDDAVA